MASGQRADDGDNDAGDISNSELPVLTVYMPSDNDGESVSSSGSGCPSPVLAGKLNHAAATTVVATTTAAGKGILVHNNKRSANTNRVSFMASSTSTSWSPSSSASSTPSPPAKRSKDRLHRGHHQKQQQQQQQQQQRRSSDAAGQLPYHMRTGRRLTSFGIKSYLHDFYDDPDDRRELFQDGDDDDFKYSIEPTEIRWRRHCGGVYAALGLAVTAVGLMAMAAGHLIPARDPFVDQSANVEVVDQGAVEFNELLASCRYVGSAMFAAGVVFTVVRFWMSVIRGDRAASEKLAAVEDDRNLAAAVGDHLKRAYADRRRSSMHQPLPHQHTSTVRIPVTGSVENVQPDPRAIHLRFDRFS